MTNASYMIGVYLNSKIVANALYIVGTYLYKCKFNVINIGKKNIETLKKL